MRISYWSSDVCSSDLTGPLDTREPLRLAGLYRIGSKGIGMRTSYALLSASFGVVLLLTPPGGAVAQTPCSKPIQPICPTDMQTAATEAEQLRCQEDVKLGRASCRERGCQYVSI